jgi:hypothetical protein
MAVPIGTWKICVHIPTIADEPAVSVSPAFEPWSTFYDFRVRWMLALTFLSREVRVSPPPV